MRYLVVLETAPGRTDFGVTVPDLPGCTSAGDTLDEALGNAEDAILSYLGVLADDGKPLPGPSRDVPLELGPHEVVGVVKVDLEKIDPPRKAVRLNVSIPGHAIDMIDRAAGRAGTHPLGVPDPGRTDRHRAEHQARVRRHPVTGRKPPLNTPDAPEREAPEAEHVLGRAVPAPCPAPAPPCDSTADQAAPAPGRDRHL